MIGVLSILFLQHRFGIGWGFDGWGLGIQVRPSAAVRDHPAHFLETTPPSGIGRPLASEQDRVRHQATQGAVVFQGDLARLHRGGEFNGIRQQTHRSGGNCGAGVVLACLGGVSLERGASLEEVRGYIREPANLVWVDIQDPGLEEFSHLLDEFGFHPLALEDAAKGQQRPKVDEYKGYLFAVFYNAVGRPTAGDVPDRRGRAFIGRNYLVTTHRGRNPAIEDAMTRWTRGGQMLREGIGFAVYTVLDALIDSYFPVIDTIENELEASESQMFLRLQQGNIELLLRHKRTLFALRRVLSPLRDVLHVFLRHDHPIFSANTAAYFQNVYDHVLRLLDALDMEREMVGGMLEAHLAVVSNRLNATMKTLTVLTVAWPWPAPCSAPGG